AAHPVIAQACYRLVDEPGYGPVRETDVGLLLHERAELEHMRNDGVSYVDAQSYADAHEYANTIYDWQFEVTGSKDGGGWFTGVQAKATAEMRAKVLARVRAHVREREPVAADDSLFLVFRFADLRILANNWTEDSGETLGYYLRRHF